MSSRKRTRTDDTDLSTELTDSSAWVRHPQLYFSDGSIVLLCDNTLFRVSAAVLAVNSEVFGRMLSFQGHQPSEAGLYDGCRYVQLHDRANQMEAFLNALFIAGYISEHASSFRFFDGVLRMCHKYRVRRLLKQFEQLLSRGYHTSLEAFQDLPMDGNEIFEDEPHPNQVLDLLRECQLTRFLPFAFLQCCKSIESILDTGHPLSISEGRRASLGFTLLQRAQCSTLREMFTPHADCTNPQGHIKTIKLGQEEAAKIINGCAYSYFWVEVTASQTLRACCEACQSQIPLQHRLLQRVWNDLPTFFELPRWTELEKGSSG